MSYISPGTMEARYYAQVGVLSKVVRSKAGVPLLAEAAFAGGTERSGQNCAERVGLSAQLAVQL